jgi:glycine/sarcosine N-methyltransferase
MATPLRIRSTLRSGGLFIVSIRDYDHLLTDRPIVHGPALYSDEGTRASSVKMWDWIEEREYVFHLYTTREMFANGT